jgi:hypothetical protein
MSNGNSCSDTYSFGNKLAEYGSEMVVEPSQTATSALNNVPTYSYAAAAADELAYPQKENFESTDGLNNPGCIQEGYTGPNDFYTVPGTFQSELSPRFMNEGFGANITYNFPEQRHLAAEPDNPLSLANNVENYEQQVQENYENVETKFAQVHEPVPLPRSMDGPHREDYGGKQNGGGSVEILPGVPTPQFKMYDRMIISTAKNNQTNSCDMIRGDLAIYPSTKSCGWFQSRYADPMNLCTGALQVLGGKSAVTEEIAALQLLSTSATTAGGASMDYLINEKQTKSLLKNVSKEVGDTVALTNPGHGPPSTMYAAFS